METEIAIEVCADAVAVVGPAVLAPQTRLVVDQQNHWIQFHSFGKINLNKIRFGREKGVYVGVREFVSVRIDDRHEVPVQVVDILRMGRVVLHQFADDPGHGGRWDPLASVNSFR